jgi:hypothetical protein
MRVGGVLTEKVGEIETNEVRSGNSSARRT